MLPDTWGSRDLPVLRECLKRLDEGIELPSLEGVRVTVGLSVTDMRLAISALESAWPPYIEVGRSSAGPAQVGGHLVSVSERARRELGAWPSVDGIIQAIIDGLGVAADEAVEPEAKSRLRSAAEVVGGVGRDVLAQVIAAKIGNVT